MKTLAITDHDSGMTLDRVQLSPEGQLTYETGVAQSIFDGLIASGMTPSRAFEMRTGWSNGYLVSNLEK